ncbi:MAG: sigma-70 family RNA polymerase sigma factor [Lutibacter sp.]
MTNEGEFIKSLLNNKEKDKAFKKLLDLYQERLYWHIRKLVITHENTDDVLQNTFLRVYKNLPNFKQNSTLHTWMYRIAYNESIRFLEENKRKNYLSIDDVSQKYINNLVGDSYFEGDEIQLKLQRILSELPEKERIIFQMKYFDDLKFREMEDILGIKEGTLKSSYYSTVKHIEKNMLDVELLTKNKV